MDASSRGITWLHVSDLHFGHEKKRRLRIDQTITSQEIINDAKRLLAKLGTPDFIFATGDVAFKADAGSEYPRAAEWLNELTDRQKQLMRMTDGLVRKSFYGAK